MHHDADALHTLKRQIATEILALLDGWSQPNAAALLESWQPRVSELRAGRLERYSLDRLVRMLARLGRDVTITTHRSDRPGVLDHSRVDGLPTFRRTALQRRSGRPRDSA